MTTPLRLRPLALEDEPQVRAAQAALATSDGFPFVFDLEPETDWPRYVERSAEIAAGTNIAPDRVRMSLLVAEVEGDIVGRTSIRHALTDWLLAWGGHIGYCVLPDHRRRGYAREILRQSLLLARSYGVGDVLVTCDDDNAGSIAVIEAAGGVRDEAWPVSERQGVPVRRYWIRG